MSNIYEELLAAGGFDQGRAVNPLNNPYFSTGLPSSNPALRPDSNTATFSLGAGDGSGFFDFSGIPGAEQFANGPIDPAALSAWLQSRGYQLRQSDNPDSNTSARFLIDSAGQLVGAPQVFDNTDNAFRNAALAAAIVTGANVFSAFPAAAGGSTGGAAGGAAGGATAPAAGGATAFPVAEAGTIVTTPLTGGATGAVVPGASMIPTAAPGVVELGGAAAGAIAPAAGGIAPAAASAVDPIAAYLTTGASEMSTIGNAITGAGGASGAVGGNTAASFLQQAGNFVGNLATNGGARSIFDIVSGIYGMNLARDARETSDPFAQYRGFYGNQLMELERNPSLITSRPGYVAGLEAIGRNNAARGYAGSGNETAVLSRYAGDFYGQEMQRLASLAGANQTPGAGQFQAAQLTGQSLASIGYGLAPFLGGPR